MAIYLILIYFLPLSYNDSYADTPLSTSNASGDINKLSGLKYGDVFIEGHTDDKGKFFEEPTSAKTEISSDCEDIKCYVKCSCNTTKGWSSAKPASGTYYTVTDKRYASGTTCYKKAGYCDDGYFTAAELNEFGDGWQKIPTPINASDGCSSTGPKYCCYPKLPKQCSHHGMKDSCPTGQTGTPKVVKLGDTDATCYSNCKCKNGYFTKAELLSYDKNCDVCYTANCKCEKDGDLCYKPTYGAINMKVFTGRRDNPCNSGHIDVKLSKGSNTSTGYVVIPSDTNDIKYESKVVYIEDVAGSHYYYEVKCFPDNNIIESGYIMIEGGKITDKLVIVGKPHDSGSAYLTQKLGNLVLCPRATENGKSTTVDSFKFEYSGSGILRGSRSVEYSGDCYNFDLPYAPYTITCGQAEVDERGTGGRITNTAGPVVKEINITIDGSNITYYCDYAI